MMAKQYIDAIAKFLETCSGREKVLRLLYYGTKCVHSSGICSEPVASKLLIFQTILDDCRVFLRLFDDLPMLSYTLTYGLGKREPDSLMQVCGVAVNVFDQLYFPLEHMGWAAERGLLPMKSGRWWTACTMCWVFSIYFSLCKSLRYFSVLQSSKECKKLMSADSRSAVKRISQLQMNELLTLVQCLADLVNAINWLPRGVLWSEQLSEWQIGALGTLSSVLSLYQAIVNSSSAER